MEIWKDVEGWEGWYEVSDVGRVRQKKTGRVLKQWLDNTGYLRVTLTRRGVEGGKVRRNRRVHTVVALAFLGERPVGREVCHGSGGRQDNSVGNLRYGCRRENNLDKRRHGAKYTSKYWGVSWNKQKGKWQSMYEKGHAVRVWLGRYSSEVDAAMMRDFYAASLRDVDEPLNCEQPWGDELMARAIPVFEQ